MGCEILIRSGHGCHFKEKMGRTHSHIHMPLRVRACRRAQTHTQSTHDSQQAGRGDKHRLLSTHPHRPSCHTSEYMVWNCVLGVREKWQSSLVRETSTPENQLRDHHTPLAQRRTIPMGDALADSSHLLGPRGHLQSRCTC